MFKVYPDEQVKWTDGLVQVAAPKLVPPEVIQEIQDPDDK